MQFLQEMMKKDIVMLSEAILKMQECQQKLNEAFQGRGGGKPQMVQGSLKGTAKNISEIL